MKRYAFTRLSYVILIFALTQGIGCGTAKSVYRKAKLDKKGLTKKVLVLPVMDHAGLGEEKAAQIKTEFVDLLNEEGQFMVRKTTNPVPFAQKMRSHEFGIVVDPHLIKHAEEKGINVVIVLALNPFELTSRKSGIWPFRELRQEAEVSLLVDAVDPINGTLFLTSLETILLST